MITQIQGDFLRDIGHRSVLEHSPEWKDVAIVELVKLANRAEEFSSDDLREQMRHCDISPSSPNGWGAIIRAAATTGLIRKTGKYIKSQIPSCHARMIAVWTKA